MGNVVELKQDEMVPQKEISLGFIGWGSFAQGLHAHFCAHPAPWNAQGWIYPFEPAPALPSWEVTTEIDLLLEKANVIFLEASYQKLSLILPRLRLLVSDAHLLVFLGADCSFRKIAQDINEHKVARCLTSSFQRFKDISIVFAVSPLVAEEEAQKLHQIFAGLPVVLQMESEEQLNAVQGLLGTVPALGYTLIDALADGILKMHIPRKTGLLLAAHALFGAARTFLETEAHPGVLRDESIQEKGTPLSGLMALEKSGFRGVVVQAIEEAALEAKNNSKTH